MGKAEKEKADKGETDKGKEDKGAKDKANKGKAVRGGSRKCLRTIGKGNAYEKQQGDIVGEGMISPGYCG